MDTLTPAERSERMSRVRGKDTRPEISVRRIAHALGFRYRLHVATLPGHPDLVFPVRMKIIFVHGCFFHRHAGCPRTRVPKTKKRFWLTKFEQNVQRDRRARATLRRLGWSVLTIWECETENAAAIGERLSSFLGGA